MDVGIIGGSGYGGAELLRLLAGHPYFTTRVVAGGRAAGARLGDVFGQLRASELAELQIVDATSEALADCDVVFSATPHGISLKVLPDLVQAGRVVVDLSGAFRLPADVFGEHYGMAHTAPALTPAPYGLPELWRDDLPGAQLIAGPGCYPTAALLALAPLAGMIGDSAVSIVGMSGWSGAGRGLRDDLHASHAHGNVGAYGAPGHRHAPEIAGRLRQLAGAAPSAVTFVPHLVPMPRGMVVTVTVPLADAETGDVRALFVDRYRDEPFVTVLDSGWPQSTHTLGANTAQIGVTVDSGVVVVSCALDNLVKGAAGQAIQAANVATECAETTGLPTAGLYP